MISFLPHSSSSILRGILFLIMSSFLSDSTIGMGDSDYGGLIQQPLIDWEAIFVGGSSSENTHRGASNSESSSLERVRALHRTGRGISHLCGRAWPSATSGVPIPVIVILPTSASSGVTKCSGCGDVKASPHV